MSRELQAYKRIELVAQWEGHLNTHHLMDSLGVSRQTASGLIGEYKKAYPNNLDYSAQSKSYQPTPEFRAQCSSNALESYVEIYGQEDQIEQLGSQQAELNPLHVRQIIQAINQQQRLDINYASLNAPQGEDRIISPHTLINDGSRWHMRAWCEKSQAFRDFVLTRIRQVYGNEGSAVYGQQEDEGWNTWVSFSIEPDQRLSESQRQLVALDYNMQETKEGKLKRRYRVRGALVMYWLQKLRIDRYQERPEAQQIILSPECAEQVKPWRPDN